MLSKILVKEELLYTGNSFFCPVFITKNKKIINISFGKTTLANITEYLYTQNETNT